MKRSPNTRRCRRPSSGPLFMPLFTEVRGRGILRSPYPQCCIQPARGFTSRSLRLRRSEGRPQDLAPANNYAAPRIAGLHTLRKTTALGLALRAELTREGAGRLELLRA